MTFSRLLSEGRGDAELAETYQTRIDGETAMTRHVDAIACAREGLRKLAFALPKWGSKLVMLFHVLRLEFALRGHTSESILALPLATNERTRVQTVLLMAAGPAAFFTDTALMSLLALRVALLTLRRGLTEFSSYGFASYALVLGGAFQRYTRAYEFGLLAKRLNERLQNRALDCKLEFMFTMFCLLALAQRHQVHNVAALAFERLARWHEHFGSMDPRRRALEGATETYRRWGAHACADRVRRSRELLA